MQIQNLTIAALGATDTAAFAIIIAIMAAIAKATYSNKWGISPYNTAMCTVV